MYYNPEGLFSICFLACIAWWFWLGHKVIKAGDDRETARRLGRVMCQLCVWQNRHATQAILFCTGYFVNKTLKPSSTDKNNLLYQAKNVYLHLATLPLTSCRNLHPLPPLIPNLYFLTSFVTSSFPK